MSVITPTSQLILIKSPLEYNDENTLDWTSLNDQYTYFSTTLPHKAYPSNLTYIRRDNNVRCETDSNFRYEDLLQYNYCMYKNTSYSNKWIYAFITDCRYVNDGMSEITIKTDCWQTWWSEITLKPCYIERCHVADDTRGKWLLDEGLETGDYINRRVINSSSLQSTCIILSTTVTISDMSTPNGGGYYGGVFNGTKYYVYANDSTGRQALINKIKEFSTSSTTTPEAINSIFIAPTHYIMSGFDGDIEQTITNGMEVPTPVFSAHHFHYYGSGDSEKINKPSSVDGYIPKNNKLFCYPYCYLVIDNNAGSISTYHYELFYNNEDFCDFIIYYTPTPGGSCFCSPVNYDKPSDAGFIATYTNMSASVSGGKFPICGWQNDIYTNWLTEQGTNLQIRQDKFGLNLIGSALGGANKLMSSESISGMLGGLASGTMNVMNSLLDIKALNEQVRIHSMQPPSHEGNANIGDITYALGNLTFTAYRKNIRAEVAKVIDDYFTMFGYKINRIDTPTLRSRPYFNYIKTANMELTGGVPQSDINEIKNRFNNGVRFWHNTTYYLDYTVDNRPV